jgi:hypothetical protein
MIASTNDCQPKMEVGDVDSVTGLPDVQLSMGTDMGTSSEKGSFAQGMYISLWPKIEQCHNYVSVLLVAQEELQQTIDRLVAGMVETRDDTVSPPFLTGVNSLPWIRKG